MHWLGSYLRSDFVILYFIAISKGMVTIPSTSELQAIIVVVYKQNICSVRNKHEGTNIYVMIMIDTYIF